MKPEQIQRTESDYTKKKVVVSIGGNAILYREQIGTFEEQYQNIIKTAKRIVSIISCADRFEIVALTHGNGPQVGNIAVQQNAAASVIPKQPMYSIVAMTQGQIGYMLQQAIQNELMVNGINKKVISVITQTIVDCDDLGYSIDRPSKPIGPFYTLEEAQKLSESYKYTLTKVKPSGNRVWRRVVPSPKPLEIVETDAIRKLVEDRFLVIASGGGGIPVVRNDNGLHGVDDVVIDKDLVAGLLGSSIGASVLLIITDIDQVKLNFGKPNEISLSRITLEEVKRYIREGHFTDGSMGPKIKSAIEFIEAGGKVAIITSINEAVEALNGHAGTMIDGSY